MKISFFYTPKPRQFSYNPRFYDPEREKFEKLKAQYKLKNNYEKIPQTENEDLAYFQSKIKSFDNKQRNTSIGNIFKKKEMPKFNYKPRFVNGVDTMAETSNESNTTPTSIEQIEYRKKITFRRPIGYDRDDESPMAEPIPASKIFIYATVIIILLLWILL